MKGRTVLITGASAGIGEACAEVFAEAGARLILWARRTERLELLAQRLRNIFGVEVLEATLDVRDRGSVQTLVHDTGPVDVLINNAGLSRGLNTLQEGVYQDWEEMIDTNVKGLLYVTREILPGMVSRGDGMIINMASIAGRQAYRGGNVYGATKAAVKMLSDSLQIDVNGTGVRVCNIDPGLVETEFSIVRYRGDEERATKTYKGLKPLSARDIAEIVLFVATRPKHVSIQDILVTPTAQASVSVVTRT